MSVEGRKKLEGLREAIKAFISTPVHTIFVSNTERDLAIVEERILDDRIESEKDFYEMLELKGQRTVLKANITLFEDAVSNLDNSIQEMLDRENQTTRNSETE